MLGLRHSCMGGSDCLWVYRCFISSLTNYRRMFKIHLKFQLLCLSTWSLDFLIFTDCMCILPGVLKEVEEESLMFVGIVIKYGIVWWFSASFSPTSEFLKHLKSGNCRYALHDLITTLKSILLMNTESIKINFHKKKEKLPYSQSISFYSSKMGDTFPFWDEGDAKGEASWIVFGK